MKIIKSLKNTGWILGALLSLHSCAPKPVQQAVAASADHFRVTDFTQQNNWAALPQKTDPSDELPVPLSAAYERDSSVDVFFIHPTTFTGDFNGHWNADLQDHQLNHRTDISTIRLQASVFNTYNLYAPRYQQAHIHSFYTADKEKAAIALERAYQDIRAAFQYYLDKWNQGRPIILAAHSQGTFHAKQLMRDFFEGKALRKKLVAAYLIGYPVEPGYFSQVAVCADSVQTGCYLGWRTFRHGFEPAYDSAFRQSVVVNPLSWTTDSSIANVELHKGAVLRNFKKIYYRVSDAQVHGDLLWISRPRFPGSWLYKSKNYHIGDINLFYMNIRQNLALRVRSYWANQ